MSLKYRDSQGTETPVAGLNGTSGELVPSVALQQSGTVNFSCVADSWTTVDVTFVTPMPDTDYLVVTDSGATEYVHVQNATTKRTTGFTMIIWNRDAVSNTGIIRWTAFKLMTDTVHEADSAHIAQNTANFAPAFSEVTSYAVGDYVTYNNVLYRCTIAHTAGTWVAGHFTVVTVGGSFTSFPDYAHPISIPNGANTWTATQDCYVTFFWATSGGDYAVLYIDSNQVSVQDSGGTEKETMFCGYVKKGQVISSLNVVLSGPTVKIYPLI